VAREPLQVVSFVKLLILRARAYREAHKSVLIQAERDQGSTQRARASERADARLDDVWTPSWRMARRIARMRVRIRRACAVTHGGAGAGAADGELALSSSC
jgi:hypothetical protein